MAGMNLTFVVQIKDDSGHLLASDTTVVTSDGEISFNVSVPAKSGPDGTFTVDLPVDVSTCQAFYIVSTKALTMTENDDGTPDLTASLAANVPYWWRTGQGTNPFTVDVTSLKFTNAGAEAAVVQGSFIVSA